MFSNELKNMQCMKIWKFQNFNQFSVQGVWTPHGINNICISHGTNAEYIKGRKYYFQWITTSANGLNKGSIKNMCSLNHSLLAFFAYISIFLESEIMAKYSTKKMNE